MSEHDALLDYTRRLAITINDLTAALKKLDDKDECGIGDLYLTVTVAEHRLLEGKEKGWLK